MNSLPSLASSIFDEARSKALAGMTIPEDSPWHSFRLSERTGFQVLEALRARYGRSAEVATAYGYGDSLRGLLSSSGTCVDSVSNVLSMLEKAEAAVAEEVARFDRAVAESYEGHLRDIERKNRNIRHDRRFTRGPRVALTLEKFIEKNGSREDLLPR